MWLAALAAPAGVVVGATLHEASHAIAAEQLGGTVVDAGWSGGVTGGPYIQWRGPEDGGLRPLMVGVAPVGTALLVAVMASIVRPASLAAWLGVAGVLIGLVRLSVEDVSPQSSRRADPASE